MAKEAWRDAVDKVDAEGVIELARGALRVPSLCGEETAAATYFRDAMRRAGLEVDLQPVPPSAHMGASHNAIGRMKGSGGGPTLLFNGHIDHNPICDGWTHDPYKADVEQGWLYGFVHMKAANACYIAACDAVRRAGIPLRGDVAIALVCGELRGGAGTQHALRNGLTADYFVLGEPTEMQTAVSHTASMVCFVHVLGRMKHFATENVAGARGVNAVEKAMKIVAALGPSHRPLPGRDAGGWLNFSPAEGFEGLPQLNIGGIRAGIGRSYNTTRPALFPDVCTVTVDIRIVPGMSRVTVEADLRRLLDGLKAQDQDIAYEIEWSADTFPLPFSAPRNTPVVRAVTRAHARVFGEPPQESKVLKFAASDASWMGAAGIAGIIYGPTGRYLSRPDERCETTQLVAATKAYAAIIADMCTKSRTEAAAA